MGGRYNILEPPDELTEPEKRRWRNAETQRATLWAGEWFWNDALRGGDDDYDGDDRRRMLGRKQKLKQLGRPLAGQNLICSICYREALIVTDAYGGVCSRCEADKKNEDEENFWASIGCPD